MALNDLTTTHNSNSLSTASYEPVSPTVTQGAVGDVATEILPPPDLASTEAGLIYGLLALLRGLIAPESLIHAMGVWSRSPGRELREILVEQGHLEEAEAQVVDELAATELGLHDGSTHEALADLGEATRLRLKPDQIADPEIRNLLKALADDPAPRPPIGSRFGSRYEIIGQHARGGLGIISLANDRDMHREVALKEIRVERAHDPDYRLRFLREAEVTGRLEHPGIVPVYGIGQHEDGRPYYIMRFIRGVTLKIAIIRLHKPRVNIDEVEPVERYDLHGLVGRFIAACQAVAYAHDRNILHRDIKPANIMLGPFGETLVVDWGLAKSFEGSTSRESDSPIADKDALHLQSGSGMTPTMFGSEIGTIGYMSPEQSEGRLDDLGPPSDIYSLGVTLYLLAAGRGPFDGLTRAEFLRDVRVGEFPRPRQVKPSIPRALEAVILKAMASRPIDRYQSATELAEDLERWRAGQPVLAYPEPWPDRLGRWAKRHRTPLAGAAVFLICATIGLVILAEREREENIRIKADRDEIEKQRAEAEAGRQFALKRLKDNLNTVAGADMAFLARSEGVRTRLADDLTESYRELLRKKPGDPRIQFDLAQACQLAANIGRATGKFDRPPELYAEALRLLEALVDSGVDDEDVGAELAMLHDDIGEYAQMLGHPDQARAEHQKGLETLARTTSPGRDETVARRAEGRLQLDFCGALADLGRFGPAEEANRRAIELLGPLAEATDDRSDRLMLVFAWIHKGNVSRLRGDLDRAKSELADAERQARAVMAASYEPDTRMALASVRLAQGDVLLEAKPEGYPGPALKAYLESCSHMIPLYENMPQMVIFPRTLAAAVIGRGTCYLSLNQLEKARADFAAAQDILKKLDAGVPKHYEQLSNLGVALTGLGRVSKANGEPEAARTVLVRAVDSIKAAIEANASHPELKRHLAEAQGELAGLEDKATPTPPRP